MTDRQLTRTDRPAGLSDGETSDGSASGGELAGGATDDKLAERAQFVADFWADTHPVDDDYDWDADIGAVEYAFEPPSVLRPVPPPRPPFALPAPVEMSNDQIVVLGQDSPGEFVRACRARAGFSQRDLARESGVDRSVIGRIEAGQVDDVRMSTLVRLTQVCDVMIVGAVDQFEPLLASNRTQRHVDHAGRLLPAHLANWAVGGPDEQPWWGRLKYSVHRQRSQPQRTYTPGNFVVAPADRDDEAE